MLKKNQAQTENKSVDRTSQCSNRLSNATPLKQICESDTGGIIPRAIKQIVCEYQRYQDGFVRQNFILKMSVVEIYNDVISDLLSDGEPPLFSAANNMYTQTPSKSQAPQIKELNVNGNGPRVIVQNVQEKTFETYEEGLAVLRQALSRRQVHETTKNIASSRSHAIFLIKLYSRHSDTNDEFNKSMMAYLGGSKYS